MSKIQAHLERVSRSFAFCIARLDDSMQEPVGLAYLLCRLLDTVEDAAWESRSAQLESFAGYMQLLNTGGSVETWAAGVMNGAKQIPNGELLLLKDAEFVFQAFRSLDEPVRAIMIPPIISMAQGMRAFTEQRSADGGKLRLPNLAEVNRYCFFVAGVVGEILTGLLAREAKARAIENRASLADGFHFGLFLQKVNLLKDRSTDLSEGRDLVPGASEELPSEFVASALGDAKRGFAYMLSIPKEFSGYRLFCAWSLFLGLASLPHIALKKKIGRLETVALLAKVERILSKKKQSNEILTKFFEHKMEPLEKDFRQAFHPIAKDVAAIEVNRQNDKERCLESYRRHYVGIARDEELLDVAGWT